VAEMAAFGILVKSYSDDVHYVRRLIASLERHNADEVPAFLVVPESDLALFGEFTSGAVTVLSEKVFEAHLTDTPLAGFSAGYINQEIIKMCFWEAGLVDNYLCLDSDAEFIRDFNVEDFMFDSQTPFTFLSEDRDLLAEPEYFEHSWQGRALKLDRIKQEVGLTDPRVLTVHGHAVFSATVLRSFVRDFLQPRGWDYRDAVTLSPYEPTWYSMWLQATRPIPLRVREPIIKTFHNSTQHLDYVLRGLTADDISRGYVGVVVNSNYSRGGGVMPLTPQADAAIASYLTTGEIVTAMWWRVRQRFFSGQR